MEKEKCLYCCSSYYQLLVSLMAAMAQGRQIDLVLEEHGIETAKELAGRLEQWEGKYVGKVFVCPNSPKVDPYRQRCASFLPWQRNHVVRHMEGVFAGEDVKNRYGAIHVFWDLGYAGTYFNIRRIHYTLHEDSLNSYQHIRGNRPHYAYIFQKPGWKFFWKKHLHMGVIPFGYSDCCDAVEVNERKGIEISQDKVREAPWAKLEGQLGQSQKKKIYDFFLGGLALEGLGAEQAALLLTEPFAITGRLPSREAQIQLYQDVAREYAGEGEVLIKPHPRDDLDYGRYIKNAKVMEKNIPMEVLNFHEGFRVRKAVTVTSSAIQGIGCADEKIYLGAEFLEKYR